MIVVVDTNVFISAMEFASPGSTPVLALQRASLVDTLATCDEIDGEIVRLLVERFRWPRGQAEQKLSGILENALHVTISGTLRLCRDPDDDKFLECAERGNADFLISGDKDLLALRQHGRTRILTPAAYLKT